MTILDLRDAPRFSSFSFTDMHEGLVVSVSDFTTKGTIKVVLPDLLPGSPTDRATNTTDHINLAKVMSTPDLKYNTDLTLVNYVECYPIAFNGFSLGHLQPNRGDSVMVFFLNGDTKLPYYLNAYPLKERPDIMDSSNENFNTFDGWGYYRIIKLKTEPMVGPDVQLVGEKLKSLKYEVDLNPETGSYEYDEDLFETVKLFQKRMGLTEDGEVGPITWRMLMRNDGREVNLEQIRNF